MQEQVTYKINIEFEEEDEEIIQCGFYKLVKDLVLYKKCSISRKLFDIEHFKCAISNISSINIQKSSYFLKFDCIY